MECLLGYNYCYSTCLGRIQHLGSPGPYIFGCTQLKISPNRLRLYSFIVEMKKRTKAYPIGGGGGLTDQTEAEVSKVGGKK